RGRPTKYGVRPSWLIASWSEVARNDACENARVHHVADRRESVIPEWKDGLTRCRTGAPKQRLETHETTSSVSGYSPLQVSPRRIRRNVRQGGDGSLPGVCGHDRAQRRVLSMKRI